VGNGWEDRGPGERHQRRLRADSENDADPIPVTYRQARLIANLIDAAADGHNLTEALRDISAFLWLTSIQATLGPGHARVRGIEDPEDAWSRVERWPIPPPGPPRPQPEWPRPGGVRHGLHRGRHLT
jgi:hypothetical protein